MNIRLRDEKEELCEALTRLEASVVRLARAVQSERRKKEFWIGAAILLPMATLLMILGKLLP
jgi:hypothetical protein